MTLGSVEHLGVLQMVIGSGQMVPKRGLLRFPDAEITLASYAVGSLFLILDEKIHKGL